MSTVAKAVTLKGTTPNYPASVEEAHAMLAGSAIGSYRVETIGDWCIRRPEPLPDKFFKRFAASVASDPRGYGRLFFHALQVVREGGCDG